MTCEPRRAVSVCSSSGSEKDGGGLLAPAIRLALRVHNSDDGTLVRVFALVDHFANPRCEGEASSSPTSPCRAQGNRPWGSGTTHRNLACSWPIGASDVRTDFGSPGKGDACPVSARNHTVPPTPVNSLIVFPP